MSATRLTAKVTQSVMWGVAGLLTLRVFLRLVNADVTNRIVQWVYDNTQPAVTPFANWFPQVRVGDGFNVEVAAIFALVGYLALGFVVLAAVGTWKSKVNSVAPEGKKRFNVSLNR